MSVCERELPFCEKRMSFSGALFFTFESMATSINTRNEKQFSLFLATVDACYSVGLERSSSRVIYIIKAHALYRD